jgi:hypothetical protein
MKPEDLYDWLLENGVREPAVLHLGEQWFVGRWESVGEALVPSGVPAKPGERPKLFVTRAGRLAVQVIGEGATLEEAFEAAKARLQAPPTPRAPAQPPRAASSNGQKTNGALHDAKPV